MFNSRLTTLAMATLLVSLTAVALWLAFDQRRIPISYPDVGPASGVAIPVGLSSQSSPATPAAEPSESASANEASTPGDGGTAEVVASGIGLTP
ncbi:MAG: hypothetical protein RMJ52_10030, partial [Gemmataceae bacterium]|nr:hypothetical protein [Gemmataceae bacterium]